MKFSMNKSFYSFLFSFSTFTFNTDAIAETTYGLGLAVGTQDVTWTDQQSSTKSRSALKLTYYINGKSVYSVFDFQTGDLSASADDTWTPYSSITPSKSSPAGYGKLNLIVGRRFENNFSIFGGYHLQVINAQYDNTGSNSLNIEHATDGILYGATFSLPIDISGYGTSLGFSISQSSFMTGKYTSGISTMSTDSSYLGYGAKWVFPINDIFTLDLNYIKTKTEADFSGNTLNSFSSGPVKVGNVTVESSMLTVQATVVF